MAIDWMGLPPDPTYEAQGDAREDYYRRFPQQRPSFDLPPVQPAATNYGNWWNAGDPRGSFERLVQGKTPGSETLRGLEPYFKAAGIGLEPANAAGATHKIRLPNGQVVRVGNMFDAPGAAMSWGWVPQPRGGGAPAGGPPTSSYAATFSDPSTKLLEGLLTQQMQALEAQRTEQTKRNAALQARMPAIQASTDELLKYLQQRSGQLQQGPYTGTEQEILRTQMLEPIERDRTAAQKRAVEQIGARGLEPTSGIAQELLNQVNQGFDRTRAAAQGDLAYRTVAEQRSRQQEAQQLLSLIPQVQRAAATGDLDFLMSLDAALNASRQQAVPLAVMNQRLPSQALADALGTMGMGPGADSLFNQALGLYGAQQQARQGNAGYYEMLGQALPFLMR